MTQEQQVKFYLVALAEFLQTTLTDAQVKLYAAELTDLSPNDIGLAISLLKQDAEVWPGRFPLPAKIRSYLRGTPHQKAVSIASEIMKAITKHGHGRAAEAKSDMSQEAWEVAKVYGWSSLCDLNTGNSTTLFAQIRDIAQTMDYASTHKRIALEAAKREQISGDVKTLVDSVMKEIS